MVAVAVGAVVGPPSRWLVVYELGAPLERKSTAAKANKDKGHWPPPEPPASAQDNKN